MNIYGSLFELLSTYLFGGTPPIGSYQELVCMLFSSFCSLAVVIIPFLVIYGVFRNLFGWR